MYPRIFAQFRCGILPFNIEVGRFRGIPLEDRKCNLCELGEVESEYHFMLRCPFFSQKRNNFFQSLEIAEINQNVFKNLMTANQKESSLF